MTHKDIYTKFMIEYDKANVTSSYPSLTEYEVATVLDKAYHALIAQKVTGNNVRRSTFESDIKAIADLAPLTKSESCDLTTASTVAYNVVSADVPEDMLYFLQGTMNYLVQNNYDGYVKYPQIDKDNAIEPFDQDSMRALPVKLVNHEIAQKFFSSAFNMPWIKEPVCYIEGKKIYVVYDRLDAPLLEGKNATLKVVYIKTPNRFAKDMDKIQNDYGVYANTFTYFDFQKSVAKMNQSPTTVKKMWEELDNMYMFECSDTVAEELISLAIAFALENIESSRLNAKLNMRGLEA